MQQNESSLWKLVCEVKPQLTLPPCDIKQGAILDDMGGSFMIDFHKACAIQSTFSTGFLQFVDVEQHGKRYDMMELGRTLKPNSLHQSLAQG